MDGTEFEKKVIKASLYIDNGDPMRDVLDDFEIMEAVQRLAGVYTALGILPDEE